jgi:hypothetical protein
VKLFVVIWFVVLEMVSFGLALCRHIYNVLVQLLYPESIFLRPAPERCHESIKSKPSTTCKLYHERPSKVHTSRFVIDPM